MTETVRSDGATTYRNVTNADYSIPHRSPLPRELAGLPQPSQAIPVEYDPLAQQIANLADANGVVTEEKMAKFLQSFILKEAAFMSGAINTANSHPRQLADVQSMCKSDTEIADYVAQMKQAAKLAVFEHYVTEVTVPAVPNVCAVARSK